MAEGCNNFGDALLNFRFGNVEEFMIKTLLIEGLELNIDIILKCLRLIYGYEDFIIVILIFWIINFSLLKTGLKSLRLSRKTLTSVTLSVLQ